MFQHTYRFQFAGDDYDVRTKAVKTNDRAEDHWLITYLGIPFYDLPFPVTYEEFESAESIADFEQRVIAIIAQKKRELGPLVNFAKMKPRR